MTVLCKLVLILYTANHFYALPVEGVYYKTEKEFREGAPLEIRKLQNTLKNHPDIYNQIKGVTPTCKWIEQSNS